MPYKNPEDQRASARRYYYRNHKKVLARKNRQIKAAYHADVMKSRAKSILKKRGITVEQREDIIIEQGGLCAICRRGFPSDKHTHIDHCHTTNKVRGVLCNACNSLLGYARDDIVILQNAISYLLTAKAATTEGPCLCPGDSHPVS